LGLIKVNWKVIPGYEDYEASESGIIRRVADNTAKAHKKLPFILKPRVATTGYWVVSVWENGRLRTRKVHRLVALAFHGLPPSSKHEVAHNDGDRLNPAASNLRWATRRNNFADKVQHGTQFRGVQITVSVLTEDNVRTMRDLRESGVTYQSIADRFGVNQSTCWSAVNRKTWTHVV
jgi:hypothetical protein